MKDPTLLLRRRWFYRLQVNARSIGLAVSNGGSGFRPGVLTVQPMQHETHTAEGLRRDLVSKGFNLDYLLIICPICP